MKSPYHGIRCPCKIDHVIPKTAPGSVSHGTILIKELIRTDIFKGSDKYRYVISLLPPRYHHNMNKRAALAKPAMSDKERILQIF